MGVEGERADQVKEKVNCSGAGTHHVFLFSILSMIQSILSSFEYLFSSFLIGIVYSVQSLGPLGLPMFTALFIVSAGISMDLFHFAHDLPIVGDFV